MPSIPSGEIKTVIVHVRQKNGDIVNDLLVCPDFCYQKCP